MADETEGTRGDIAAPAGAFDWDSFDRMLDGLKTDEEIVATLLGTPQGDEPASTATEGDPEEDEDPELIGPTLPRVDPAELPLHKLRARRRRVLARRAQTSPEPPADDLPGEESLDDAGEQRMAERLASRFAPTPPPGAVAADVSAYIPRHRSRVTAPTTDLDPSAALDEALESELGEPAREEPADDQVHWDLPPTPDHDRGKIALFASIAAAALLFSGVSAYALLSGWSDTKRPVVIAAQLPASQAADDRSTRVERQATIDRPVAPERAVAAAPAAPPAAGVELAQPLMTMPKASDIAGAQRLVPRPVKTETITEPADAPPAAETPPVAAVDTVVKQPEQVPEKGSDRLAAVEAPAPQQQTVAKQAPQRETMALAYAPQAAVPAVPSTPAVSKPVRERIAVNAPPEAEPAPAEIASLDGGKPADLPEAQRDGTRIRIDLLLTRGREILKQGDLAAARLIFSKVAEAGDPRGAIAMAETYDPGIFRKMNVVGLTPDAAMSKRWRERAVELQQRRER